MNLSISSFCAAGTGKLSLMIGLLLQKLRWIVAQVSVNVVQYILVLVHLLISSSSHQLMVDKHMDTSDTVSTEDGGLATPPMDIGALYLVSHGTEIQNVSEVRC
jgi:hypothetical protein